MLKPYEWKHSRTVLRRESASNRHDLVDYKELCKNLGGNLINAVGGTKGKINPLQIRPLPKDDENETDRLFNEDESYLMIDEKVPQSLIYLRNIMKRIRKYERSLAVTSHSVVDFLSDNIKQYGQALFDIPTYKILMGTDGQNLKETTKLYDSTEEEQDLLLTKKEDTPYLWMEQKGYM